MKKKLLVFFTIFFFVLSILTFAQTYQNKIIIYAPATPSSIPYIIASNYLKNTELVVFTNHSQANAMFLKDEIQILTTGLSVGINFFNQNIPVKIINSYVAGLTSLVTYGKKIQSLTELKGKKVALPFAGSPIEEVFDFFCKKENIKMKEEIEIIYFPFASSVELLKKGEIFAVALPEPDVSNIKNLPNIFVSLSFYDLWVKYTGIKNGYPQVGTFVKANWANANLEYIKKLNFELIRAIELINNNIDMAINISQKYFEGLDKNVLKEALLNTKFYFEEKQSLENSILNYYKIIGKPLDEKFKEFFFKY
jgi:ABC-type nitrate/sulfonate/bicarbonate transport system substrate-binding protein